ncbi:unnamed protein product [Rotaria sp. Silwood2]|nr:unnamed protein product [Rotaria sp. Silwood2]CAF2594865.1 unnamed protein product [Rotaria sp. Silwood2]CAF3002392.1 unnamed protein product [Rotaria sp. Silwood2]CAF3382320.1 unnamed protein product [Rotaria sp. Silwood2]CAF4163824.1 unnamed protein product [Rotaria sp. Silwood2]
MNPNSSGDVIISLSVQSSVQTVRFWIYLFFNIFSLICTFFDLYYLLADRTLRRALNNHVIIVLLIVGLIDELTNIPWTLYNDHNRVPVIKSYIFYCFWSFINLGFNSLQVELFAWATIERHILIFHNHWIATKSKRFFLHYFPIGAIIIYYLIYYSFVFFYPFCESSFDAFLSGSFHIPCVFDHTVLGMWDLIVHQFLPTVIIVFFSMALIIRAILKKNRLRQGVRWRKYKKMITQLLSISAIYIIFNVPWVVVIFAYQYGLPEDIAKVALIYTGFLYYFVIFLFPFVCCLSLSELRSKVKEKLLFWRPARQVGPTTLAMIRPRTDRAVGQ